MTFFKVLHRALPTNSRFADFTRCRLGCGHVEHFTDWCGDGCRHIRSYWKHVTRIMTAFNCGAYRPSRVLIFFTLKWVETIDGWKLTPINRHMRGIVWLAWKFLWQQLAAIDRGTIGRFDETLALTGVFRMHHTAVLGALYDYITVQQAKRAGARKRCARNQEEAEKFRVWPFVAIGTDKDDLPTLTYTRTYYDLLQQYGITPSPDINHPDS